MLHKPMSSILLFHESVEGGTSQRLYSFDHLVLSILTASFINLTILLSFTFLRNEKSIAEGFSMSKKNSQKLLTCRSLKSRRIKQVRPSVVSHKSLDL